MPPLAPARMKKERVRAHCPRCRHQQTFVKATINHPFHVVLGIVTGGLWLVSWIALCVGKHMRPWRCEHCGWHKPEFVDLKAKPLTATQAARLAKFAPTRQLRPKHAPPLVSTQTGPIQA